MQSLATAVFSANEHLAYLMTMSCKINMLEIFFYDDWFKVCRMVDNSCLGTLNYWPVIFLWDNITETFLCSAGALELGKLNNENTKSYRMANGKFQHYHIGPFHPTHPLGKKS